MTVGHERVYVDLHCKHINLYDHDKHVLHAIYFT